MNSNNCPCDSVSCNSSKVNRRKKKRKKKEEEEEEEEERGNKEGRKKDRKKSGRYVNSNNYPCDSVSCNS